MQPMVCCPTPTSLLSGASPALPASLSLMIYLHCFPQPYSSQNIHGPQGGELECGELSSHLAIPQDKDLFRPELWVGRCGASRPAL